MTLLLPALIFVLIVLLLMILCGTNTSTDTNYGGRDSGDSGKLEAHDIYHTTGEPRF